MSGPNRAVCRYWLRGNCHFGTRCKFSHERPALTDYSEVTSSRPPELNPAQASFQTWRRSRPEPGSTDKRDWITTALALMDHGVEIVQQVIRELASEKGLFIVRSVVQSVQSVDLELRRRYLSSAIMPLFRILSHQQVVDSMVLEQEVNVLYRCLLGVEASRLRTLFTFICDVALDVNLDNGDVANDHMLEYLSASAGVLAKVVDTSISNQLNPSFCQIAERFSAILDDVPDPTGKFHFVQASKYLQYVRRRLGVGKALSDKGVTSHAVGDHARFTLTQDMPGTLSQHGQRHDNDHEDISDISLMPTRDEIMSLRDEYLPTTDSALHHLNGVQGLLDSHFRLLREDLFYDLRNAVRSELEQLMGRAPSRRAGDLRTRIRTYQLTRAIDVAFGPRQGLELDIEILQPNFARRPRKSQRIEAWSQSQRLTPGSLVCAVDELGTAAFFLVSASTLISAPEQRASRPTEPDTEPAKPPKTSLADDERYARLWLQPVEQTGEHVVEAITWFKTLSGPFDRRLLEFPGILIPSALPPLKALQEISTYASLPFEDILTNPGIAGRSLTPPLYSLRPGFSFDLSCLCYGETRYRYNTSDIPDPLSLSKNSSLDPTQAAAILDSLRRCIAITQGPPGTGKSYTGEALIKVLLANQKKAQLGPILCVCYTNHALDQLLEHLLDGGVEQIVRIGSRSKSERLAEVNLRKVVSTMTRTRMEGKRLYESYKEIDTYAESIFSRLEALKHSRTDDMVEVYLADNYPQWHHELFGGPIEDEQGFQKVSKKRKTSLKQWLESGGEPQEVERDVDELILMWATNLPRKDRLVLYEHWVNAAISDRLEPVRHSCDDLVRLKRQGDSLKADLDLRCLQSANIIGVTTTGLARNLELLRRLRSKVLLCEEAGEVLEGHLLTALLPSVEHAILIGDHLQLRPQIQDWRLQRANPAGAKYSLDTSLFERLVRPPLTGGAPQGIAFNVLNTQRRMHPEIAELVRSTLYPHLLDAENVQEYPQVPGMASRLFWLDHAHPETGQDRRDATDTSRSNDFEVDLVSELVSHLLRQGTYKSGDIAVLTPYLGQLHKLRRKLSATMQIVLNDRDTKELVESELLGASQVGKSSSLAEIRAATVDNFQGEEARVVIVSLVRCNNENRAGFLNTSNRINVLLSRAKHGMYLIGNASTFSAVPMWAAVNRLLGDNCGPRLQLQCPRHTSTAIYVQKPEDFLLFSPDGGCTLPCEKRLSCGHACTGPCHSDALHAAVKCLEPCPRFKDGCDHSCPLLCGESCALRCGVMVTDLDILLDCGHPVTTAPCWQVQTPDKLACDVPVVKKVAGCSHELTCACSFEITSAHSCRSACGGILSCGHVCRRVCHRCRRKDDEGVDVVDHGPCTQACGRSFTTCSHSCGRPCHGGAPCPPCDQPCENRCQHSRCDRKCNEPCVPCAEIKCSSHCPHSACSMPCAAPCDWVPCSLRCEKIMECGHRCPSICGEECPGIKFCQICGTDEIKSVIVDYIMYSEYKDVDLDEEPCIFPDCGHPMTFTSMDGQMSIGDHYLLSVEGIPTAVKAPLQPFSSPGATNIKVCPTCRGSLRSISRYGRIVRRGLLDEATKRFIAWSSGRLNHLMKAFADAEDALEAVSSAPENGREFVEVDCSVPREKYIPAMCDSLSTGSRFSPLKQIRNKLRTHVRQVGKDEQPYQRVSNTIRFVGKQKYEAKIQMSGYLKTMGMLLRCDLLILGKYLTCAPNRASATSNLSLDGYVKDCKEVIALAREKHFPRIEAEGHILCARFFALQLSGLQVDVADVQACREQGCEQLRLAEKLMEKKPSAKTLQSEVDIAWAEVRGTFYSSVSKDERAAVYAAMAGEFMDTGHWYTCEQGHPFTIGECGMPMELARCPECGAAVGGQSHRAVEGVQRDNEMEGLAQGVNGLGI